MHLFFHRRWCWAWTGITVVLCATSVLNNLVYLPGGPTPAFLLEKAESPPVLEARSVSLREFPHHADLSPSALVHEQPLHRSWWLTALYVHIVTASVCLISGTALCFPATLKHRRLHHVLGYVYVNAVLWGAAPTGLAMAPLAKGGVWGATGFALAATLWWWTTWQGLQAILANDLPKHVTAMTRSFALALSAPAFRLIQASLATTTMSSDGVYALSLWLSLLVSLWLAESWVRAGGLSTLYEHLRPPCKIGARIRIQQT